MKREQVVLASIAIFDLALAIVIAVVVVQVVGQNNRAVKKNCNTLPLPPSYVSAILKCDVSNEAPRWALDCEKLSSLASRDVCAKWDGYTMPVVSGPTTFACFSPSRMSLVRCEYPSQCVDGKCVLPEVDVKPSDGGSEQPTQASSKAKIVLLCLALVLVCLVAVVYVARKSRQKRLGWAERELNVAMQMDIPDKELSEFFKRLSQDMSDVVNNIQRLRTPAVTQMQQSARDQFNANLKERAERVVSMVDNLKQIVQNITSKREEIDRIHKNLQEKVKGLKAAFSETEKTLQTKTKELDTTKAELKSKTEAASSKKLIVSKSEEEHKRILNDIERLTREISKLTSDTESEKLKLPAFKTQISATNELIKNAQLALEETRKSLENAERVQTSDSLLTIQAFLNRLKTNV